MSLSGQQYDGYRWEQWCSLRFPGEWINWGSSEVSEGLGKAEGTDTEGK